MIVLDTNVISESLLPSPSRAVMDWLATISPETAFTTAISHAEMLRGVELLPAGRRKTMLAAAVKNIFSEEFADRVLPFDDDAAPVYAAIAVRRARAGRPISQSDAMIAAICRARRATLATRNVADFDLCGVQIINPWNEAGHRVRDTH